MSTTGQAPWRTAVETDGVPGNPGPAAAAGRKRNVRGVQASEPKWDGRSRAALMAFSAAEERVPRRNRVEPAGVRWPAHKYQLKAVKFLLGQDAAALFLDPGLGKTSTVLAAIAALKQAKKFKRALIVAPLRVCHMTWPNEQQKWADFAGLSMRVIHGSKKEKLLQEPGIDIHVINPEGLAWLWRQLQGKWPYDVLVIDESTKFKSWTALRTKSLRMKLEKFSRRWILTGTPAPNGIADLFSQIYILDGGKRLGQYITYFRTRFMVQGGYNGYEWKPKLGALEEIEELLSDVVLRLEAKDWLELPELTFVDIPVELPTAVRKQYDQLEEEFILELESVEVSAIHAAALGMKLRQVTNGFIFDDDAKPHWLHDEKLDALEDLVEELNGSPVLVGIAFLPELEAIRKRLGYDVPYLGGGVGKKQAEQIVTDWNEGKIPVLIAHPASVSHGLNLQGACHHVCWFGLTWNLEEWDQLIRRVYRQGQKSNRVIVHNIVAAKTKDQEIAKALGQKDATQAHLLQALKKRPRK